MKTIYLTTLLLGAITLIGCGSGSSSSEPSDDDKNPIERQLAQIHKYKIVATATSGGNCKGATGDMIINASAISGTIKTGWGDVLTISGTYNKTNGDVAGGFAKNNNRLAQYSGTITNNKGRGEWSDSLGCSGTWSGEGSASNYIESSQPSPEQNSNNSSKNLNAHDIQGYELGFDYERGTSASISFGCDGSFAMKLSLSGVTRTSISGDDITVENHQLKLVSSQTYEKIIVSLDNDDNIVQGTSKVTELSSYTINSIKKISSCN
jgi:hypothetical protein